MVVGVCALLFMHHRPKPSTVELETNKPSVVVTSSSPTIEPPITAAGTLTQLPRLDFLPGSVEEACGFNELPPYWVEDGSLKINSYHTTVLDSEECQAALETHMNAVNPYHFILGEKLFRRDSFAFIMLKEPLTFERIFSDPAGDLALVQDALFRPECLLQGDDTNWELKETCHAEAFLNYSLINRFCFDKGVLKRSRTWYWPEDNPTPEQDRFMWKQYFEGNWVIEKCEELDSTLEFTSERFPELYALVKSLHEPDHMGGSRESLIELAARLGDDAAGLTEGFLREGGPYYGERGTKYGRFSWLLTSDEWYEFRSKDAPSSDRFLQTFKMIAIASSLKPDPSEEIEFDWEWVVQHLCTPPFDDHEFLKRTKREWAKSPDAMDRDAALSLEIDPLKSCQEVIHELRGSNLNIVPVLWTVDKFERVALKLGVYE